LHGSLQHRQTDREIGRKMNPKYPTISFGEHLEVTSCLRCLHNAERVLLPGDRNIGGVIGL
jgi:hypothetical protein